jgi:ABC-type branched-subunit amino acid transport system substrate-binding protein
MYKLAIENAGTADPAAVRDALANPATTFSGVTGTFAFNNVTGTPTKGAVILSFTSDGTTVTTKLVDVIKELK